MRKIFQCPFLIFLVSLILFYSNGFSLSSAMVVFRYYPDTEADSVEVVGDMTGWESQSMTRYEPEGYFHTDYLLESGRYEYFLLVDGKPLGNMGDFADALIPAPHDYVNDGFGGSNAVLELRVDETDDEVGLLVFRVEKDERIGALYELSENKTVTLFGNMNAWAGHDLVWNAEANAFEIKYYGLPAGDYEYYFSVGDTPLWDMSEYAGSYQPAADDYLSDGWTGSNAVTFYPGDTGSIYTYDSGDLQVDFIFYPNDRAYDYCYEYDEMEVSVCGSMNGWEDDHMEWDDFEEYFIQTYYLPAGEYEFYFNVCGTPLNNMSYFARYFEPAADYYQGDGMGGQNAVIIVEEDEVFYSVPESEGKPLYRLELRYYAENQKVSKSAQIYVNGGMTDHTNVSMIYQSDGEYYYYRWSLPAGEYAYHYETGQSPVENMKAIARQIEPPASLYRENDEGIVEAVIDLNSDIESYYDFQIGQY